jgi:hypothetical protein
MEASMSKLKGLTIDQQVDSMMSSGASLGIDRVICLTFAV